MSGMIEVNKADMARVESMLYGIKNGAVRAMSTSINATIRTTRVQVRKRIGRELNLSAKRIDQDLSEDKANFKKLSGKLTARGEPVGLVNFSARQTQKGVSVKVLKSSSRTVLLHAFIATGRLSTKRHVYWRRYDGPRQPVPKWSSIKHKGFPYSALPKKYRLPLERKTGPRIEDILAKDEVLLPLQRDAAELLLKNLDKKTLEILRRYHA